MKLGDFFVRLGVLADTFTVRDFSKAIGDIPSSVAGAITSLAGLSIGFVALTRETLDITAQLREFTAETGRNSGELQKWQLAAKQAGLSGDLMTGTLKTLADVYGEASIGNINPKQLMRLQQLGVSSINESPEQMLEDIRKGTRGMDPRTASALLRGAGLSPELLVPFKMSVAERSRLMPAMTGKDITRVGEFQKGLADLNVSVMHEFAGALANLTPALKSFTELLCAVIHTGGGASTTMLGSAIETINSARKGKMPNIMDMLQSNVMGYMAIGALAKGMTYINNSRIEMHGDPDSNAKAVKDMYMNDLANALSQANNAGIP